mgnify:CR=1 FL=1
MASVSEGRAVIASHPPATTSEPLLWGRGLGRPLKLSVVIPVYNEVHAARRAVFRVVHELVKNGFRDFEVVIVDDGSRDGTYENLVRAALPRNVRVFRNRVNRGKGWSLIKGFMASRGEVIAFFDGDLDIDPRQLTLMIDVIEKDGLADAVVTSKWHRLSNTKASILRRILSKAFHTLERILLGIKVKDTQTGAKAFRRYVLDDVVPRLTVKRYAMDAELLTAVCARGYRVVEVPAVFEIRLKAPFKLKEVFHMLIDLLAITYRHRVEKRYTSSSYKL